MISLALMLLVAGGTAPVAAGGTVVTVSVTGTQRSGRVLGQVFASAEHFKARDQPVLRFTIEPDATGVFQTTIALPPGRYAIAMFQDVKGTGKIETNLFGKPAVPFGFSNNARGMLGPPGFDAAAFDVGSASLVLKIQLT